MKTTIVIVGGGITGLTVAYRLISEKKTNDLPLDLILLEASDRLGGVIKSQLTDDLCIEHGPDAFLADRAELNCLLEELNLTSELLPTNESHRRAFIARGNQLIPLPKGFFMIAPADLWSFFISPLFSLLSKLRVIAEIFLPAKKNNSEDESVASFINRRFGGQLLAQVGQPLIGGIYMADVNLLSAKSTMPYFVGLEQKYGSIIKGLWQTKRQAVNVASGARFNLFRSLNYGMQKLVERLSEKLTDVQVNLNTKLLTVDRGKEKKWKLATSNGQQFEADAVVFAIPANRASGAVSSLDKNLSQALSSIDSSASAVVNLLYRRVDIGHDLNGFGFVVPRSEKKNVIACGWISKKFSQRTINGYEMIRVFLGGQLTPNLCDLGDQELIEMAHNEIAPYLKVKNMPEQTWLTRWRQGLPIYRIGHAQAVQRIEDCILKHEGLFFAGASYYGVGIPDCVASAEITTSKLLDSLRHNMLVPCHK